MRRLAFLALVLAASCDFTQYGTLADQANGIALTVPDGYPVPEYGTVVAGWSGTLTGGPVVSRVAITAGAGSPLRVLPLWNGTDIDLGTPAFIGCHVASDCAMGAGASITGVQSWGTGSLCMVAGAPTGNAIEIHCESDGPMVLQEVPGVLNSGFGAAVAPYGADHVIVGAPLFGSMPQPGALYLADGSGALPTQLAIDSTITSGAVSLGSALASAPMPSGDVLVAATAPGHSRSRVLVLLLHPGGVPDVRACLDETRAAAAGAVALGDLDGDHVPDLVVGDQWDGAARSSVAVYFGRDLPAASGCGAWGAPATMLACPEGLRTDLTPALACGGSRFGSALAIGDVNADGFGDLVAGAGFATVGGAVEAGAVYVIPGSSTGLSLTTADALTDSSPREGAHLGFAVAVAPSRGTRSEVIAGAPGANEAIVFTCSGLAGDGIGVGPHCVPPS